MSITIHQRVHLYIWHWATGPGWCRSPEIKPLRDAGARALKVQLQDDGPIPREEADDWRSVGFQVWGMAGHVHEWENDPEGLARWLKAERVRLALTGLDCNFEDEVLGFDQRSGGKWSVRFANEARRLMPTLPMHLDSYWGPMGAGINLGAYKARGFRFSVQTFWGDGVWDDPPTNIVSKGAGAQPVLPASILKPIIRVSKNNAGRLPDFGAAFANCVQAGTKGVSFYPIDSSSLGEMEALIRQAISSGASF